MAVFAAVGLFCMLSGGFTSGDIYDMLVLLVVEIYAIYRIVDDRLARRAA